MTPTPIGINLTALGNMTAPPLNISADPNTIINTISTVANNDSSGYLTFVVLMAVTFITYITVTDKSGYTDFGYSDLKGFIISLGFSSIIGVIGVMAGLYQSFKSVALFTTLFMLMLMFSLFFENKE